MPVNNTQTNRQPELPDMANDGQNRVWLSRLFFCVLLFSLLTGAYPKTAFADHVTEDEPSIAILYPTVNRQYSSMFEQYIKGIESVPGFNYISYRVDNRTTIDTLKKWSAENAIRGYIALGQTTYKLVEELKKSLDDSQDHIPPLIAGGMVATPPGISGISLSGDPDAFFRHLQLLNPGINRVFFVYSRSNNGWLIERARKISTKYNIEFVPLQVNSIKQATLQYRIILQSVEPKTDAIWIPLDDIAPLDILLPDILEAAWNKHITVFSNNIQHARRGALFSLYPEHNRQGRRLVALLERKLEKPASPDLLYPSVDFKTAVNIRTATHLGMRYSKKMIQSFDQVFPAFK